MVLCLAGIVVHVLSVPVFGVPSSVLRVVFARWRFFLGARFCGCVLLFVVRFLCDFRVFAMLGVHVLLPGFGLQAIYCAFELLRDVLLWVGSKFLQCVFSLAST